MAELCRYRRMNELGLSTLHTVHTVPVPVKFRPQSGFVARGVQYITYSTFSTLRFLLCDAATRCTQFVDDAPSEHVGTFDSTHSTILQRCAPCTTRPANDQPADTLMCTVRPASTLAYNLTPCGLPTSSLTGVAGFNSPVGVGSWTTSSSASGDEQVRRELELCALPTQPTLRLRADWRPLTTPQVARSSSPSTATATGRRPEVVGLLQPPLPPPPTSPLAVESA